jgi:hypothetical protein
LAHVGHSSGAKARIDFAALAARLKSCPDAYQLTEGNFARGSLARFSRFFAEKGLKMGHFEREKQVQTISFSRIARFGDEERRILC